MTTLLRISVVVMSLAASNLLGQTVQIVDNSLAGSPVSLRGSVTFGPGGPNDVACAMNATSLSSNPIILIAVDLTFTSPSGQSAEFTFRHDHFFNTNLMTRPGVTFPVIGDPGACAMGAESAEHQPAPASAKASVAFVEFGDGSAWSIGGKASSDLVAYVTKQRQTALAYLQSLQSAYTSGGVAGLQSELSKPMRQGSMVSSKRAGLLMTLDMSGMQGVINQINSNLATAQANQASLVPKLE